MHCLPRQRRRVCDGVMSIADDGLGYIGQRKEFWTAQKGGASKKRLFGGAAGGGRPKHRPKRKTH